MHYIDCMLPQSKDANIWMITSYWHRVSQWLAFLFHFTLLKHWAAAPSLTLGVLVRCVSGSVISFHTSHTENQRRAKKHGATPTVVSRQCWKFRLRVCVSLRSFGSDSWKVAGSWFIFALTTCSLWIQTRSRCLSRKQVRELKTEVTPISGWNVDGRSFTWVGIKRKNVSYHAEMLKKKPSQRSSGLKCFQLFPKHLQQNGAALLGVWFCLCPALIIVLQH